MKKLLVYTSFLVAVFVLTSTISYSEVCSPGLIKAMKEEGLTNKKIKLICEKAKLYDEFSTVKQSAVEGKLVDWNGKPVAGVKIIARQVRPLKGYERFEAVTNLDGTFRIKELYPSSQYVFKPWSDKRTCKTAAKIESAPQGETAILPKPMKIAVAYSKKGGSIVGNLATGAKRFTVSSDGVISDSVTSLEWVVGPDRGTNYAQARQWVASRKTAGGGWRMPTRKELSALYQKGMEKRNMDLAFKTTGLYIWAEPRDSSSAWGFSFDDGRGY